MQVTTDDSTREEIKHDYNKLFYMLIKLRNLYSIYDKAEPLRGYDQSLWWTIDHDIGDVIGYWLGTREHKSLDKLKELLLPLETGTIYVYGNYAYFTRFPDKEIVVTKKNTQKIERKHLSLRTWCAGLVRKVIRFSKTEKMHKIVVGLVINVWFFGRNCLLQ